MPPFGPISRRNLVTALRQLGYTGPHAGGKHQFMAKGDQTLTIPNPHEGDISRGLLHRLLTQAGISREAWERLR